MSKNQRGRRPRSEKPRLSHEERMRASQLGRETKRKQAKMRELERLKLQLGDCEANMSLVQGKAQGARAGLTNLIQKWIGGDVTLESLPDSELKIAFLTCQHQLNGIEDFFLRELALNSHLSNNREKKDAIKEMVWLRSDMQRFERLYASFKKQRDRLANVIEATEKSI